MVNENVSLVISRQLLTDFCAHILNLPDGTAKAVCHFTLEKIQPRVISFEEQVCVKNILGSMLESYGSCMSKSYILPGGFDQTASSHTLWERGGLEERSTGSCGNPAGDGSEVRSLFSWNKLKLLICICMSLMIMLFLLSFFWFFWYDFTDSTMWIINWTLTSKSPVCIWRTTTQFRPRPTSTEHLYFRMNPPMNSCRFTTRCTISWTI